MKKIFVICQLIIITTVSVISCQNEQEENVAAYSNKANQKGINVSKVVDMNFEKNKILKYLAQENIKINISNHHSETNKIIDDITFDYDNIKLVTNEETTNNQILVVRQKGYDFDKNEVNYALSFTEDEKGDIYNVMVLKTTSINDDEKRLEYFDTDDVLLLSVDGNISKDTVKVNYVIQNDTSRLCSGQQTMNCLSNAYTNHGWASLGLTIGSIFYPELTIIVAGGCLHSCHHE